MTREEQINQVVEELLEKAGVDTECRDVPKLWFKLGANFADSHPVSNIDWQQVRIQAAIAAMQGVIANESNLKEVIKEGIEFSEDCTRFEAVAIESLCYADELINQLRDE